MLSGQKSVAGNKEGEVVMEIENPMFIRQSNVTNDVIKSMVTTRTTGDYYPTEGDTPLNLNIKAEIISHCGEKFK